jgi:predicted dehydrogenase
MSAAVKNFLISGFGAIGRRHLQTIRALDFGAEITVLRRPESDNGEDPEGATVVHNLEAALERGIDAAIIAGPASGHVEEALSLAAAGVHLLVEKPLSDRLQGARALLETCRDKGVVLQVGYCLRFLKSQSALHRALADAMVGRVVGVEAAVGQYLPDWRPDRDYRRTVSARRELGGGALLELSHEIDYLLWHLGAVNMVDANLTKRGDLDINVEDTVDMKLAFNSGTPGRLHMDMVSKPPRRFCRVEGDEGVLLWDGIGGQTRYYRPGEGGGEGALLATDGGERNKMYERQLLNFLSCIETGAAPPVGGEDGIRVLQVVEAARRSADTGRPVNMEAVAE